MAVTAAVDGDVSNPVLSPSWEKSSSMYRWNHQQINIFIFRWGPRSQTKILFWETIWSELLGICTPALSRGPFLQRRYRANIHTSAPWTIGLSVAEFWSVFFQLSTPNFLKPTQSNNYNLFRFQNIQPRLAHGLGSGYTTVRHASSIAGIYDSDLFQSLAQMFSLGLKQRNLYSLHSTNIYF